MKPRTVSRLALPLVAALLTAQAAPQSAPKSAPAAAPPSDIQVEPVPSPEVLRSEAFVAAQYALISGAAAAVDRVTARFASGGGPLAALEQERDKKLAELEAVDRQFSALIERGSAVPEEERRALTQRRATIRDEVTAIETRIGKEFPQYFDLTRPKALDIAQVQKLLNADEAMVMILVSDDASYTWAITREKATWSRSEAMKESALATKVQALRASMEVDGARGAARQPPTAAAQAAAPQGKAFDRKLAHELYKELIAPVEPVLQGKQVLLTNVTGALTSLPLALLVTAPPQGSDSDPTAVATSGWLIDKYALAELPSVSSLNSLRCLLIADVKDAHPGCAARSSSASYAQARTGGVALAAYGAPTLTGQFVQGKTDRSVTPDLAGQMYKGKLADTEKLRALAYLPQAKAELESLGKTFGSDAQVVLGDAATETAVKTSKSIPGARFVVFSTHGLLATEVGDNAEPGLVFTPPKTATEQDDGLLTASEVAQLKLSADIVALSACNTAAGSGKGAEGLSGLARSFLLAGTRSLLVSHWAVSDAATSLLMQQTFDTIRKGDVAGRARALQAAMKTVRNEGTGQFVSPKYWAAFTLVGEPGK